MNRFVVQRIAEITIGVLVAYALWSLAYEIVVGLRWNPAHFPSEGASRWALLKSQQVYRWPDFFTLAGSHFQARLLYPLTRAEALIRAGLAAGSVVALAAGVVILRIATRPPMPFGDAKFGTVTDARRKGLFKASGIILGTMNGMTLRSDEPAHILVVGPSRSGKGTGFVLPNGYEWKGSAVFFDPKNENYEHLAAHRTTMGQKVFVFSPGSPNGHRYNPLDFVRRDQRMPTDCLVVASFVIPEKTDDTWAGAGRLLLSALIGYTLSSVLTKDIQHMRGVARMTVTGKDISVLLRAIVKTEGAALPTWVVDSFNQYIALEPETRNSAVFNVNQAMMLWNNGLISAATETSDFDIRELRREPMTIFIGCTIAELAIYRPLIRILLQQIHDLLMNEIPGPDEPHQVLLMLDEFFHVGRMDSLISKITISAGYGFRMCLILQDIAQLDELYGRHTRVTTVSGSQIKLFIQINDDETANFVSDMLGETTATYKTPMMRPGQGIFAARTWTPHLTAKPLRSPLELREMSERTAILMVRNSRSFEIGKIRHYADRPYSRIYKAYKGKVPPLPALRVWTDTPIATPGATATPLPSPAPAAVSQAQPAPSPAAAPVPSPPAKPAKTPLRLAPKKAAAAPPVVNPAPAPPAVAAPSPPARPKPALKLGAAPKAADAEICDIRALAQTLSESGDESFKAMTDVLSEAPLPEAKKQRVAADLAVLDDLHASFGETAPA